MVIDSSAIVAILNEEPDGELYFQAIAHTEPLRICAAQVFESQMVLTTKRGRRAALGLLDFIETFEIDVCPFDSVLAAAAFEAFFKYGKGRDPAARLNFGDCMSYALAKHLDEPLLFKGKDFIHTDIVPAL